MDDQFAVSSAVDDTERHYIGDLLSDDDAFSCAFKSEKSNVPSLHSTSPSSVVNLPGPFAQIGPSPNGNFWPEPPPPYSATVGSTAFSMNANSFQSTTPITDVFNGTLRNNNMFYPPEKSNEQSFSNAWPDNNQSMFSDYYKPTLFDGFSSSKSLEQHQYEPFNFNNAITVKVDSDTDYAVWSHSKDSSPLDQSPKTSNFDEDDRSAHNISPLSRTENESPKSNFSGKLAEIENNLLNPKNCDSTVFCPPVVNLGISKQSYSDAVTNRSGELKNSTSNQATPPKSWPRKQHGSEKRVGKAGSVDRVIGSHRYGNSGQLRMSNSTDSDFRKIIRKKGARPHAPPLASTTTSAASSNTQSPAKKRSESVAVCEPLYADKRDISAGVVVHNSTIKMDSSSRFEVLQSLSSSPTKKQYVTVETESQTDTKQKDKPATEATPRKSTDKSKRRGLHHKLIGSVSQSRSASKKPIPVTAVGTIKSAPIITTKKNATPQLTGGIFKITFNLILALLAAAVEFLFHQLTSLFFAVFFAIQQGAQLVTKQLCNAYRMLGQFLLVLSSASQQILRRVLVTREQRLAMFLAKEPLPSLQELDEHFLMECNEALFSENIQMPHDVETLLERLYKCFYVDPYVVLGLARSCSDEDITSYYNAQSALVDPEKMNTHGCAQAYDLLTYAYAAIGTPDERESYDKWAYPADDHSESTESNSFDKYSLWRTWCIFRGAMDQILRTLHCDCGINHMCVLVSNKNPYEARQCRKCDCLHPAKQNDIWAESTWGGLYKCFYACLEGNVYDVSQWAACSCTRLKNVKSNSHNIHYRLQGTAGYTGLFQKGKNKNKSNQNRNLCEIDAELLEELVNEQLAGDAVSAYPDRPTITGERPRRAGRRRRFR